MADHRETLKKIDREVYLLRHAEAVLGWDQETCLPPRGVEERAEQLALLRGLVHERITSPAAAEALAAAEAVPGDGLPGTEAAFHRAWRRRHDRAVKLPRILVEKLARAAAMGQARWGEAKKAADFSLFLPFLREILALTRESAERIGYAGHPYDALLDEYEPWMTTAETDRLFSGLKNDLVPLLRRIAESPARPPRLPAADYPAAAQEAFSRKVLDAMGFPRDRGRLDVSVHPFTTSLGADDVRITTRYDSGDFRSALFGTIHEGGHALYELGFGGEVRGTLLADGTSLGIHESQSRLWENMIGRSLPFWSRWYPALKDQFPGVFDSLPLFSFYRAVNAVEPSLIRIEADEVTYSLHIILRFRLEKELVAGALRPEDLPGAWNELSRELLGKVPANDAEGVLQDIHWSMGAVGYFPTYALGNLYAAQFLDALRRDLPGLDDLIAGGNLFPAAEWLRGRIHSPGASRTAAELVRDVTGAPLDPSYFIRYLSVKYGELYEL